MKKVVFLKNAVILTATALLLRAIGIFFRVWMAGRLGAEGMGLYQLVFSVYVLAATFATSGISTAVTRLVTDELALGTRHGTLRILRRAILLTTLVAVASMGIVFFGAHPIAKYLLGDLRAVPALKILCFSLPFMGISSCLRGYFIARRRAGPSSSSQILEQIVRIAVVVFLVGRYAQKGLAATCGAVLFGDTAAEGISCLFLYLSYLRDRRSIPAEGGRKNPPFGIVRRILHIALPISSGRYLNSGLRTVENILMPTSLAQYGGSKSQSLGQFGMIKGMALPILFFPASLLNAVSTLLIPEMSEASAKGEWYKVKSATLRAFQITLLLSFFIAAVFLFGAEEIGWLVYKDKGVSYFLRVLAPLVPFMYLDSVCDGMLKGLDQQVFTFQNSVLDSALRIPLILLLVPAKGMPAFLGIMYFSNLFTSFLNAGRLIKVSKIKLPVFRWIVKPLLSIAVSSLFSDMLARTLFPVSQIGYLAVLIVGTAAIYFPLLFLLGSVSRDDL